MAFLDTFMLILNFVFLCQFGSLDAGLLDVEEFKSFSYSVDILDDPVLSNDATLSSTGITVYSKLGQPYHCLYNIPGEGDDVKTEEQNITEISNASLLLEPLRNNPCLNRTFGWWTYEYCHGLYIKQYHMDDAGTVDESSLSVLGYYTSDFDWLADDVEKSSEYVGRYHSQSYLNGTICDLTGKQRLTTVRFRCSSTQSKDDFIVSLAEPSTCEYVLTISTSKICKLRYLKSLPSRKLSPITCSPILHSDEYNEYLEYKKNQEELKSNSESLDTTLDDTIADLQRLLSRSHTSSLIVVGVANDDNIQSVVGTLQGSTDTASELEDSANDGVEVITSIKDLKKILKSLRESISKDPAANKKEPDTNLPSSDKIDNQEDEDDEASSDTVTDTEHSDDSDNQNDNNVDNNQNDDDDDDDEISLQVVDIAETADGESSDLLETSESSADTDSTNDDIVNDVNINNDNDNDDAESVSTSVDNENKNTDDGNEIHTDSSDENEEDTAADHNTEHTAEDGSSDGAGVDSTSDKADTSTDGKENRKGDDATSDTDTAGDDASDSDLKNLIKTSLLKGAKVFEYRPDSDEVIDINDEEQPMRQLEIKILNADYYDKDGKPVSSDPGKRVVAMFQQNDAELEEYDRQQKLENNYNFNWKPKL